MCANVKRCVVFGPDKLGHYKVCQQEAEWPRSYQKIKVFAYGVPAVIGCSLDSDSRRLIIISWFMPVCESLDNPVWLIFTGLLHWSATFEVNRLKWEAVFWAFAFEFGKANIPPQIRPRRRASSWTICMLLRWASNTWVQNPVCSQFLWGIWSHSSQLSIFFNARHAHFLTTNGASPLTTSWS